MAKKQKTKSKKSTKKRASRAARITTVAVDYIKSTAHRVVFVNGAHGGLTPTGRLIHMSLFNDRSPIPRRDTYSITRDGKLGPLKERTLRSSIVREVETTLVFDLECARSLRKWLDVAIQQLEPKRSFKDGSK